MHIRVTEVSSVCPSGCPGGPVWPLWLYRAIYPYQGLGAGPGWPGLTEVSQRCQRTTYPRDADVARVHIRSPRVMFSGGLYEPPEPGLAPLAARGTPKGPNTRVLGPLEPGLAGLARSRRLAQKGASGRHIRVARLDS